MLCSFLSALCNMFQLCSYSFIVNAWNFSHFLLFPTASSCNSQQFSCCSIHLYDSSVSVYFFMKNYRSTFHPAEIQLISCKNEFYFILSCGFSIYSSFVLSSFNTYGAPCNAIWITFYNYTEHWNICIYLFLLCQQRQRKKSIAQCSKPRIERKMENGITATLFSLAVLFPPIRSYFVCENFQSIPDHACYFQLSISLLQSDCETACGIHC